MEATLQTMQAWMSAHPGWAGFVIFLIAFAESLALVGVFIPGASLLIAAGAMIGAGILDLWPSLFFAILGAILGDNLSYWLGYHYRDRLRGWWPFNRYPYLLIQGQQFFQKHGGKSVALGRFVGPIRAVIPAVAGLMRMRPRSFFTINVLSAIVWAPTYMFPGIIIGAWLKLAAEVTGRLALFLLIVILLLWFSGKLVKRIFLFIEPRAELLLARLLSWSGRNKTLRFLTATIVDPDQPETKGLFSWALILFITTWMFGYFFNNRGSDISVLDMNIYHWLQLMRTPWGDTLMLWINSLGESATLLPSAMVIAIFLLFYKQWKTALHWIAAIAFTTTVTWSMGKYTPSMAGLSLDIPKFWQQSYPQIDTTLTVSFYAYLAVIIAQHLSLRWRSSVYSVAFIICVLVIFAKLYLGLSNASFSLGAATFALTWTCLLGIAYRRHYSTTISIKALAGVATISFCLLAIINTSMNFEQKLLSVKPKFAIVQLSANTWWQTDWQKQPALRKDAFGRHHPLNVQWAGKLDDIHTELINQGWQDPRKTSFKNTILFMSPNFDFERLPVLPHVYRGRHENLIVVRATESKDKIWVLRLWQTSIMLKSDEQDIPLYLGNISKLSLHRPFGIFTSPKTEEEFNNVLTILKPSLDGFSWQSKKHQVTHSIQWNGELVVVQPKT